MKKYLELAGRIVNVNPGNQSFVIASNKSPKRLRVYAADPLFEVINRYLATAEFDGKKGKELTGTFYIQGRVLVHINFCGFDSRGPSLEAIKKWVTGEGCSK